MNTKKNKEGNKHLTGDTYKLYVYYILACYLIQFLNKLLFNFIVILNSDLDDADKIKLPIFTDYHEFIVFFEEIFIIFLNKYYYIDTNPIIREYSNVLKLKLPANITFINRKINEIFNGSLSFINSSFNYNEIYLNLLLSKITDSDRKHGHVILSDEALILFACYCSVCYLLDLYSNIKILLGLEDEDSIRNVITAFMNTYYFGFLQRPELYSYEIQKYFIIGLKKNYVIMFYQSITGSDESIIRPDLKTFKLTFKNITSEYIENVINELINLKKKNSKILNLKKMEQIEKTEKKEAIKDDNCLEKIGEDLLPIDNDYPEDVAEWEKLKKANRIIRLEDGYCYDIHLLIKLLHDNLNKYVPTLLIKNEFTTLFLTLHDILSILERIKEHFIQYIRQQNYHILEVFMTLSSDKIDKYYNDFKNEDNLTAIREIRGLYRNFNFYFEGTWKKIPR